MHLWCEKSCNGGIGHYSHAAPVSPGGEAWIRTNGTDNGCAKMSALVGDNTTRERSRRDFIDSTVYLERMCDLTQLPVEYSKFKLEKLKTQVDHNRQHHILEKPPINTKKPI